MANEVTIPLLPCRSIDDVGDFYTMLGFTVTHRQERPNHYLCVQREDLQLHFFGVPDLDPERSYGSCLVFVPDVSALYQSFADGMRARHGKVLLGGIPRVTRPRKRKNTGQVSGFSVVDPGGNWIRIFQAAATADETDDRDVEEAAASDSRLARTLENAIVLGDSKGDAAQAAKILDGALARADDEPDVTDVVQAFVYRAELAMRLGDLARVEELLTRVRATALDDSQRALLADALASVEELDSARGA
ncbi:VOC family protein [Micromonospora sp. KC213]|uniref:bleomycin resistance protein n=1 Tax=Micromonospora sp. KC213 TaxID=2530378 RepID=UPI0010449503|nr:VOC family protein [Micromonospora sp. KC213]TDC42882.1 VOC family protein [Micromonospora sp. KC213]